MTEHASQNSAAKGPALTVADPWDAPYFGVPVYLRYQANSAHADPPPPALRLASTPRTATTAVPTHVVATAAVSAYARSLPWDGPYFGAPIYLHYPAYPVAMPMSATATGYTPSDDSGILPADNVITSTPIASLATSMPLAASVPPRRRWLARLFGGR